MLFGHIGGQRLPLDGVGLGTSASDLRVNYANPLTDDPKVLDGTCTSDGRLIWLAQAWRIVSNDSLNACKVRLPDWTAAQIIAKGYQVFVGPFPWNPNPDPSATVSVGGVTVSPVSTSTGLISQQTIDQVTTRIYDYTRPGQISAQWRAWIGAAMAKAAAQFQPPAQAESYGKPADGDPWGVACTQSYNAKHPWYSQCVNPSKGCDPSNPNFHHTWLCPTGAWICDPSTENQYGIQSCQCSNDPGSCMATTSMNGSGGIVSQVTKMSSAKDADGNPVEVIAYSGDPLTYYWYSPADWLESFEPGLSKEPNIGFLFPSLGVNGPYSYTTYDAVAKNWFQWCQVDWADPSKTCNMPPTAKFRHPLTGETWGLFFGYQMTGNGNIPPGGWNVAPIDDPNTTSLVVGIGPMPSQPWWSGLEAVLEWVPMTLGSVAAAVVGAALDYLEKLVCSNPASAIQQASKNPQALAAVLVAQQLCPKPPTTGGVDCTNPANAAICQPAATTPWWQSPVVILGAVAAVFGIIVLGHKHQPAAQAKE